MILGHRGVLLGVRSDLRGWELPGGTVEKGEAPELALIREVLEETGLDIEVDAFVGEWRRSGFRPHTVRVYRCRVISDGAEGERLLPGDEVELLAWHDPTHPPEELFPWYREALHRGIGGVAPPAEAIEERWGMAEIVAALRIDLRMRLAPPPGEQIR